mmetsp:Transcript_9866/g.29351  ORF Transcript_9866/g.29351 Transcript_9866/m.29351 type:complete len:210 (-) Transcript_9866:142-771(-)
MRAALCSLHCMNTLRICSLAAPLWMYRHVLSALAHRFGKILETGHFGEWLLPPRGDGRLLHVVVRYAAAPPRLPVSVPPRLDHLGRRVEHLRDDDARRSPKSILRARLVCLYPLLLGVGLFLRADEVRAALPLRFRRRRTRSTSEALEGKAGCRCPGEARLAPVHLFARSLLLAQTLCLHRLLFLRVLLGLGGLCSHEGHLLLDLVILS